VSTAAELDPEQEYSACLAYQASSTGPSQARLLALMQIALRFPGAAAQQTRAHERSLPSSAYRGTGSYSYCRLQRLPGRGGGGLLGRLS
jgi:hypothetical protein